MKYSLQGYSATSMLLSQPGIYAFTSLTFHFIPDLFYHASPVENYSQVSPQKIFENCTFSTRALREGVQDGVKPYRFT